MPIKTPAGLSEFWSKYKPEILSGLGGAGLGAAALGVPTYLSDMPEEEKNQKLKQNLALGATLGGATGVGGRVAYDYLTKDSPGWWGRLGSLVSKVTDKPSALGVGGAVGAHMGLRKMLSGGKDHVKDSLKSIESLIGEGTKPQADGSLGIASPEGKTQLSEKVNQMLKGHTLLGKLSQNPTIRALGLNVTPAGAEQALVAPLAGLYNKKNYPWQSSVKGSPVDTRSFGGQAMIEEVLANHPTLLKAVQTAGSGAHANPISRSEVGSLGGRAVSGMLLSQMFNPRLWAGRAQE